MELLDSRRLTGPNLVWSSPGALLEVRFSGKNERVVELWKQHIVLLRNALGLPDMDLAVKRTRPGAWLVVGGPIDQLYGLIDLSELAWQRAVASCGGANGGESAGASGGAAISVSETDEEATELSEASIAASLAEERNPALLALQREAERHNVAFLWDDDLVSLGMGVHSQSWPVRSIPDLNRIDWSHYSSVPIAVITGTNGKSTNVRLLSFIATLDQRSVGSTSTDWIRVGDEVVDTGDYSGPGGARTILRHPKVELAILETARGGLLRRGAGPSQANVAVITNVAEDHMGQYGIDSVEELAEAKLIVAQLVEKNGVLVLNADDANLLQAGKTAEASAICWFSLDSDSPTIQNHLQKGGTACFVESGSIVFQRGATRLFDLPLDAIPITLGGKARYNVSNCLSVVAAAFALKLSAKAIQQGLERFESTPDTNPGRSNYFQAGSHTVLLDYAHNVHGLKAILDTTARLTSSRRIITLSTAGDRTDREIRQMVAETVKEGIDVILLADCVGYERELGKGGVPKIMADEMKRLGRSADVFDSELDAAAAAFELAEPRDMIILLVKAQRQETLDLIHRYQQASHHASS